MKKFLLFLFGAILISPVLSNAQCTITTLDLSVCSSQSSFAVQATSTQFTTYTWTTSGTGTFNSTTLLNPVYTPSTADKTAGSISLIVSANGGACIATTAIATITLLPVPTINAGFDQTACAGAPIPLNATISTGSTLSWTSNGTGTFSSLTSPTTTYTTTTAGTATLTATVTTGACVSLDQVIITILPVPTINAGFDQTACAGAPIPLNATISAGSTLAWTSNGTGTFSSLTSPTTTYTSTTAGTATLTATATTGGGCLSLDQVIITILPAPTINAGFDQTACAGAPIPLNATISAGASLAWTSNGTGTFSSLTSPTTTYTSTTAGTATLTATATTGGGCLSLDQVIITILPAPTINAGLDLTICPNTPISLTSAAATNTTAYLWSTSGTGTFSNMTALQPIYQPSAADAATGSVTLTLRGTNNSGCTNTDNLILTVFNNNEHVNAGPDQVIASGTASFIGTATGTSTISWSSNGTGVFNNSTSLNTIYTPSAADIANGIVKIKLTSTSAGICTPAEDELLLTIGSDLTISGTINAAVSKLDNGVVLLFKQGTSGLHFIKSDTVISSDNGSYAFNHIPTGTYVVLASPATGSSYLNTYLPTYSGGTQTWTTAESISITSTTSYNISLTAYTSADPTWNTGTDIISGFVDVSPAGSANARITSVNVPAAYVTVYLTNAAGNKIAYTQTDKNGRYSFKNVKAGNYRVLPEFAGTALAGPTTSLAVVSDGTPSTTENGSMSLEERTSTATSILNTTKSTVVMAYPNPAKNYVSIDLPVSTRAGEIKLFNETGAIKLQQQVSLNNPTVILDIESLPAGIYLMQLVTDNEIYTSKIVKY